MSELRYGMENLVIRAMKNARPNSVVDSPRWIAVKDTFGCGRTVAHELCEYFGLDPDEMIAGMYK